MKQYHTAISKVVGAQCERELEVHNRLKHPNIIRLIGWTQRPKTCMFTERADTDLNKLLSAVSQSANAEQSFPLAHRKSIIAGVASALAYMHAQNPPIVHCDFKPANVLLVRSSSHDAYTPKVADFGLSIIRAASSSSSAQSWGSTDHYAAPEVLLGKKPAAPADMWAFGVTVWQLLTLEDPYFNGTESTWTKEGVMQGTCKLRGPSAGPEAALWVAIAAKCLVLDPSGRLQAKQVSV